MSIKEAEAEAEAEEDSGGTRIPDGVTESRSLGVSEWLDWEVLSHLRLLSRVAG